MKTATVQTIGAFDAKTRLSELLARAANGESFVITKHGKPMARLVPEESPDLERMRAAAERLKSFRGKLAGMTQEDLRADRHAGHRF